MGQGDSARSGEGGRPRAARARQQWGGQEAEGGARRGPLPPQAASAPLE